MLGGDILWLSKLALEARDIPKLAKEA